MSNERLKAQAEIIARLIPLLPDPKEEELSSVHNSANQLAMLFSQARSKGVSQFVPSEHLGPALFESLAALRSSSTLGGRATMSSDLVETERDGGYSLQASWDDVSLSLSWEFTAPESVVRVVSIEDVATGVILFAAVVSPQDAASGRLDLTRSDLGGVSPMSCEWKVVFYRAI